MFPLLEPFLENLRSDKPGKTLTFFRKIKHYLVIKPYAFFGSLTFTWLVLIATLLFGIVLIIHDTLQ